MSNPLNEEHNRGQEDGSKGPGHYDPPERGPIAGLFDSNEKWDRDSELREAYREGWRNAQKES